MEKIRCLIGECLFKIGFKPYWSTGIHGGTTCGYGNLSDNGYFTFSVWSEAIKFDTEYDKKNCPKP